MTGYVNPASLTERVAREVFRLGRATVDDMQQAFPEKSRGELHKALANGVHRGRIVLAERGQKSGKANGDCFPGTYVPGQPLSEGDAQRGCKKDPLTIQIGRLIFGRTMTTTAICAALPGYSKAQIKQALVRASQSGMVRKVAAGQKGRGSCVSSMWEGLSDVPRSLVIVRPSRKPLAIPRVASVWGLAGSPVLDIPAINGRRYAPLGSWTE